MRKFKVSICVTIMLLVALTVHSQGPCPDPVPAYDVSKIDFAYDPNRAVYQIIGSLTAYTGEVSACDFGYCGPLHQIEKGIAIHSDNLLNGMSIVSDPNWALRYAPLPEVTGVFYVDFSIGYRIDDSNEFSVSDRKTLVIKVEKGVQFLPMCGG